MSERQKEREFLAEIESVCRRYQVTVNRSPLIAVSGERGPIETTGSKVTLVYDREKRESLARTLAWAEEYHRTNPPEPVRQETFLGWLLSVILTLLFIVLPAYCFWLILTKGVSTP